jgi:hypothetical protein
MKKIPFKIWVIGTIVIVVAYIMLAAGVSIRVGQQVTQHQMGVLAGFVGVAFTFGLMATIACLAFTKWTRYLIGTFGMDNVLPKKLTKAG